MTKFKSELLLSVLREKNTLKENYIKSLFAKEDKILERIRLSAKDKANIQLSPQEGKLLYLLLKLSNAKSVLEIGTFVGYSCTWIARALPEGGKVVTIEKNNKHYEIARNNLSQNNVSNKIELMNVDAKEYMYSAQKSGMKFDAIFIDGRKDEYCQYLDLSEQILNKSGLIIADNTLLFDIVTEEEEPTTDNMKKMYKVMREFNYRLADSTNYISILLSASDGLTIAMKK